MEEDRKENEDVEKKYMKEFDVNRLTHKQVPTSTKVEWEVPQCLDVLWA